MFMSWAEVIGWFHLEFSARIDSIRAFKRVYIALALATFGCMCGSTDTYPWYPFAASDRSCPAQSISPLIT